MFILDYSCNLQGLCSSFCSGNSIFFTCKLPSKKVHPLKYSASTDITFSIFQENLRK